MAVAFLHLKASFFVKLVKDFGVQCFTSGGTVNKARKVVLGKILTHQIAVHCWRGTEGCYLVFFHLFQKATRHKGNHVIGKNGTSCKPLSVNLSPHRLCPACLCQCQMEAALHNLLPVLGGNDVAQWVGKVVLYHLGIAGSAGGKVQQHNVIVGGSFSSLGTLEFLWQLRVGICKGKPAFSVACSNQGLYRGGIGHS